MKSAMNISLNHRLARRLSSRLLAMLTLLVATALCLSLPAAAPAANSEVKKLAKAMKIALAKGDVDLACAKAGELGGTESVDATKVLLEASFQDPFPNAPGKTNRFLDAVRQALSNLTDSKSTDLLVKFLRKKSRNSQLKILIIQILADRDDDASETALIEALEDRSEDAVLAAVRALGQRSSLKAVDSLIKLIGRCEKSKGTLWFDTRKALTGITGNDFETAADWRNFWEPRRDEFNPETDRGDKSDVGGTVVREAPKLFGSEITSKKVVIILDVSGSMHIRDAFTGSEDPDSSEGDGGTQTGGAAGGAAGGGAGGAGKPGKVGQCSECNQTHGGIGLPKHRQRIERAKKELAKVVASLPKDTRFNIMVYSTDVRAWQATKLVVANSGNKKGASGFVMGLSATGVTCTQDALEKAFEVKEADTFYLLSDGAPTSKDGQALPPTGQKPEDESMEKIYERVKQLNRLRRIKIHTLAFEGAYKPFMTRLAADNQGDYRSIP